MDKAVWKDAVHSKNETARNLTEKRFRAVCICSSDEAGRTKGVPVWRIETFAKVLWGFRAFFGKEQSFLIDVKKPEQKFRLFKFGSPTWARTRDLRINSPSLYRLSYRGMGRIIMAGKNVSINIFKKMVQNISNVWMLKIFCNQVSHTPQPFQTAFSIWR